MVKLLFLKKTKTNAHVAARYGRSYWPFFARIVDIQRASLDDPRRKFRYEYPLTMVRLSRTQRKLMRGKFLNYMLVVADDKVFFGRVMCLCLVVSGHSACGDSVVPAVRKDVVRVATFEHG